MKQTNPLNEQICVCASLRDKNNFIYFNRDDLRDIVGFEGFYMASIYGDIISLGNKTNHINPILLKKKIDKDGYFRVILQKNKDRKYFIVSRLVAQTFIKNNKNLSIVNHIDENKQNNNISNLEWVNNYGNWKHSEHKSLKKECPVAKMTLNNKVIAIYKSLMEASRKNGINQGNITNCLNGRCHSVGGFEWKKYNYN